HLDNDTENLLRDVRRRALAVLPEELPGLEIVPRLESRMLGDVPPTALRIVDRSGCDMFPGLHKSAPWEDAGRRVFGRPPVERQVAEHCVPQRPTRGRCAAL